MGSIWATCVCDWPWGVAGGGKEGVTGFSQVCTCCGEKFRKVVTFTLWQSISGGFDLGLQQPSHGGCFVHSSAQCYSMWYLNHLQPRWDYPQSIDEVMIIIENIPSALTKYQGLCQAEFPVVFHFTISRVQEVHSITDRETEALRGSVPHLSDEEMQLRGRN